jgi:hypothetical protein
VDCHLKVTAERGVPDSLKSEWVWNGDPPSTH